MTNNPNKRIVFVVAGYDVIGLGHAYRCLNLASVLTEHELVFVCTDKSRMAYELIGQHGYAKSIQVPGEKLEDVVLTFSPSIVVNDILDTSSEYLIALKNRQCTVICLEDRGAGLDHADLVIDCMYGDFAKRDNLRSGIDYFDLRDEFRAAVPRPIVPDPKNALITFGGSDFANLTLRCLGILGPIAQSRGCAITVITGPGYSYKTHLQEFIARSRIKEIHWLVNGTSQMAREMMGADFAVTGAGRTIFELTSVGTPAVVLAVHSREAEHTFPLVSGCTYLGEQSTVSDARIAAAFAAIFDKGVRENMRKTMQKHDLTKGRDNILRSIREYI